MGSRFYDASYPPDPNDRRGWEQPRQEYRPRIPEPDYGGDQSEDEKDETVYEPRTVRSLGSRSRDEEGERPVSSYASSSASSRRPDGRQEYVQRGESYSPVQGQGRAYQGAPPPVDYGPPRRVAPPAAGPPGGYYSQQFAPPPPQTQPQPQC